MKSKNSENQKISINSNRSETQNVSQILILTTSKPKSMSIENCMPKETNLLNKIQKPPKNQNTNQKCRLQTNSVHGQRQPKQITNSPHVQIHHTT